MDSTVEIDIHVHHCTMAQGAGVGVLIGGKVGAGAEAEARGVAEARVQDRVVAEATAPDVLKAQ